MPTGQNLSMKSNYLLPFLLAAGLATNAQITVSSDDKPAPVVKTVVEPYDSSQNFIVMEDPIQYRRLTGQRVFFAPRSKFGKKFPDTELRFFYKTKPGKDPGTYIIPDNRAFTDISEVESKYFTIINVQGQEGTVGKSPLRELEQTPYYNKGSFELALTLKKEENGQVYVFILNHQDFSRDNPLILVPFYEKQKELYKNKLLKAKGDLKLSSTASQAVEVKKGDKWTCNDITLIDEGGFRKYYWPCYVIADDQGHTVNFLFEHGDSYKENFKYNFMTAEAFDARELKQKQDEEAAKVAQQKEFDNARAENLKKFGPKWGKLVNERNVTIGMTQEMVYAAWGAPDHKGIITISGLQQESWRYELGNNRRTILYFHNGKLTSKQTF